MGFFCFAPAPHLLFLLDSCLGWACSAASTSEIFCFVETGSMWCRLALNFQSSCRCLPQHSECCHVLRVCATTHHSQLDLSHTEHLRNILELVLISAHSEDLSFPTLSPTSQNDRIRPLRLKQYAHLPDHHPCVQVLISDYS